MAGGDVPGGDGATGDGAKAGGAATAPLAPPPPDPFDQPPAPPPVEEGAPTWVVTFGDMMSLLLTFFILLFSMSELEMERFLLASQSLSTAVGGVAVQDVPNPTGMVPDPASPALKPAHASSTSQPVPISRPRPTSVAQAGPSATELAVDRYLERLTGRLQRFVDDQALGPDVRVEQRDDGVYLRLGSTALFRSGDATVLPAARASLTDLAALVGELEVGVAVSGHADNRPIDGQFASNWELSAARAAGVARLMVEAGLDPSRLRVESFGEHRPIASNDTAAGRARNRRVDLFFSRSDVRALSERIAVAAGGSGQAAETPPEHGAPAGR